MTSANSPAGVRQACWWLALLTVAVLPFLAAVGYARSGVTGILAAFLAGGVCCSAAVASLLVAGPVRSANPQALPRILFGMLIRMGLPLAACMAMLVVGGPLVMAGAPVMVLVYYLLMLVAETWLLLQLTAARVVEKNAGKVS
jgi:hypothetical protein